MKFIITLFFFLAVGCATTPATQESAARDTVVQMVNAIDTKQWNEATSYFAKDVFVDYSSMTGQPGSKVTAKQLVGSWEKLLAKVDTHHMLSNFVQSADGNQAEVISHVYASHSAKNIKPWDIFGRYHHKLQKTSKGWKIVSMKLIVHGQRGNTKFLQDVSQK